jgi:hypothetical protein
VSVYRGTNPAIKSVDPRLRRQASQFATLTHGDAYALWARIDLVLPDASPAGRTGLLYGWSQMFYEGQSENPRPSVMLDLNKISFSALGDEAPLPYCEQGVIVTGSGVTHYGFGGFVVGLQDCVSVWYSKPTGTSTYPVVLYHRDGVTYVEHFEHPYTPVRFDGEYLRAKYQSLDGTAGVTGSVTVGEQTLSFKNGICVSIT